MPMRNDYCLGDGVRRTWVQLSQWRGDLWCITSVDTQDPKERGKGHATALMKQVLSEADAEGVNLFLGVSPSGLPETLDGPALTAWYERLGFVKVHRDMPGIMYRGKGNLDLTLTKPVRMYFTPPDVSHGE